MTYAIEMNNITKKFPGVVANDNITLKVKKQEVHSLLGENGSGKSTLMNVLFGLHQPDFGEIFVNGKKVNISNPENAHALGIGMVHQHFMLVEKMSALDNIILGNECSGFFIDRKKSYKEVEKLVKKYGFHLDLNKKVSDLSIGMKQRVEILKTLYRGADTVILDEPTAVLTPQEVEELFNIINNLKDNGKTIIFITHKLNEIMEVADTVTVIRRGKHITTIDKKETTAKELARHMVGRNVKTIVADKREYNENVILEMKGIKLLNKNNKEINLKIREGEILGIAGVEGNGQLELEELVIGLSNPNDGELFFKGQKILKLNPAERKNLGIGYIPSDRFRRAILPDFTIKENFLLGFHETEPFVRSGYIQDKVLKEHSEKLIKDFDIRVPNSLHLISNLSGGNQQKVVLARETSQNPELIIAAQPTRGLDVGAIEYIHQMLLDLKSQGKAIILISAELTEVMNLSDRIAVMYEGNVQGILNNDEFEKEKIGMLMAGDTEEDIV